MITKEAFISKIAAKMNPEEAAEFLEQINKLWDEAFESAMVAKCRMPGIGILSITKRLICFLAVFRELDAQIAKGRLSLDGSQVAIQILTLGLLSDAGLKAVEAATKQGKN